MKLFHSRSFVLAIVILSLTACGGGGGSETDPTSVPDPASIPDPTSTPSTVELSGQFQKGPFIVGTEITIQELNTDLTPTGRSFQTETTSNLGDYILPITLTSSFVEISANGYYFNEVTGELSSSTLRLSALADTSENTVVNINILTHLAKKRIRALVASGNPFSEAKQQGETEVSSLFSFDDSNTTLTSFDQMDISQTGGSNAFLLLASSIFQKAYESSAELSEYIESLSQDLSDNGAIDNDTLTDIISATELIVDLGVVRTNLEEKYTSLGQSVVIPEFESLINRAPVADVDIVWSPDWNEFGGHIGTPITFDGSGSHDLDNDDLEFEWTLVEAPNESVAVIEAAYSSVATFTPDVKGNYSFQLIVDDGEFDDIYETATISTGNRPAKAVIVGTVNFKASENLILDGSESYDLDNDELVYSWSIDCSDQTSEEAIWDIGPISESNWLYCSGTLMAKLLVWGKNESTAPIPIYDGDGSYDSETYVRITIHDFTKISSTGEDLPLETEEWSCVRDDATGLIWEVKTASDTGLHASNNTYRWGGQGADAIGTEFYDDWDSLVDGTNSEEFCGYSDWRVATKTELAVAQLNNRYNRSIMGTYFPYPFISWSTTADGAGGARYLSFITGNSDGPSWRAQYLPVRLVR